MRLVEVLQLVAAIGGAVATAFQVVERRLLKRLRGSGATSPESAIALPRLSAVMRWRLARLVKQRSVVAVEPGRVYLDEASYRAGRARRAVIGVSLALLAIALVVLVFGVLH